MQVPSDKVIMYTYLKAACEALFEELDNFREWICDELDDNMGWYFLDDNLNDYMNRWHHDELHRH